MKTDILRKKILGCWLGKNIGGTLGGPYEGNHAVQALTYYNPVPTQAMPNDDLELQAMYAAALTEMEKPEVSRHVLGNIWLKHMNFHVDEYAVAMRNLAWGIQPPWSGSFDNQFTCGMGAAIRSELWACLAPGNPALAAKFAYEDACIDHAGDGIYAEIFNAAAESLAFVCDDIHEIIEQALNFIPEDSVIARGIREAVRLWDSSHDWLSCRNTLFEHYACEMRTDVRINLPFTILALLSGGGDFGKTICDAANCGMDTDCTAATAGALLGILNPDGISEEWLAPIGHDLIVRPTAIRYLEFPPDIEGLTDQILALKDRIPAEVNVQETTAPDLEKFKITAEVYMHTNPAWYRVRPGDYEWQPVQFNPISGKLALPEKFRGKSSQILVRFQFRIHTPGKYTLFFNSPTTNMIYLDVDAEELHDDEHMLFGRQRLFKDQPLPNGYHACLDRPLIFYPTPCGAPLNQYKRYLPLEAGLHTMIAVFVPQDDESEINWGWGVCAENAFLTDCFICHS